MASLILESQDKLDHVLFLFRRRGQWGTVARSRDAGLHGRKPLFPTIRQLVMSYVDPYVDGSGRITGYGVADLRTGQGDLRLSEKNVWEVERALIKMPHKELDTSTAVDAAMLRQFGAIRAKYPHGPVTFYSNKASGLAAVEGPRHLRRHQSQQLVLLRPDRLPRFPPGGRRGGAHLCGRPVAALRAWGRPGAPSSISARSSGISWTVSGCT